MVERIDRRESRGKLTILDNLSDLLLSIVKTMFELSDFMMLCLFHGDDGIAFLLVALWYLFYEIRDRFYLASSDDE